MSAPIPKLAIAMLVTNGFRSMMLTVRVRNCWQQWTRECTHARKTGSGATRKITRRKDRRIMRQALVDPSVTRSTIRADVGVAIVPQTISRHLAEANLNILRTVGRYKGQKEQIFKRRLWPVYRPRNAFPS
ncbi:uncharacterized protein TNCV_4657961 [Trichonephila clavipes]|nr:uncharacterized protein TNCV_4657961 [Trichonephila clavipes]